LMFKIAGEEGNQLKVPSCSQEFLWKPVYFHD
jgi:hypothetical protein